MRNVLLAVLLAALTLSGTSGASEAGAQRAPVTAISSINCATGADATAHVLRWHGDAALKWATWPVALGPRGVSARIIAVDVDPARVALSLDLARDGSTLLPWSLDAAPADALLAMNAGQFTDEGPWGWVVHRGREWQAPGIGPLSGAFVIDSTGRVRIVAAHGVRSVRTAGRIHEALQSFPLLLEAGRPSRVLCDRTTTLDREHRDIRLALGVRADGHVLIALSRYDGAGRFAERLPIGPTTMEMAEIMHRLGAVDALMLDGGLSAQLLLRDGAVTHRWAGLRSVPLALVGRRIH
jgi:hypothetical protein